MVLPVFYQLDPSQIHDLSGRYGEALSRHQEDCAPEEVESWRHASKEIANLKGWDSRVIKDETTLIKEIVSDIQKKLENAPSASIDAEGLVGMQSRVKHIESLLSFGSTGVLIVGIWGMGGIASLPESIGELKSLVELALRSCKKLASLPSSNGGLKSLVELKVYDCSELASLPESIGELKCLKRLDLDDCSKLASLPSSIGGLKSLVKLEVGRCSELASLPESIGELKCLEKLGLRFCKKLASLPSSIGGLKSLVKLGVGSVLKVPYDCSAVADLLYSLIIEARFENNRFQKPKKQPKTSSNHRSAIVSRPFKFPIPSLLSPLPQNLKKEHSNLSDQVKTAKDSFLGPPNIVDTLQKLGNEYELLRKKYLQELSDRKRLYNEVIELKGNIRVFCRCRPLNQVEITNGSNYVVEFDSSQDMKIISSDSSKKQFKFDHVFEPEDNQEAVFAQTKPIVASVLDGYNACIFAYGQTGTGKTFTMEGSPENRGVNYRTFLTGGDCKTLMFIQISPSATDLGETLCSLNFASRVRGIESGPARKQADLSELFKYKQMVEKKLQDSLQSLQLRLAATEHICRTLQEKVRELENKLGEGRKTRLKQETRAFAAAASQSTIQVVEKRKIDKKPPLCPSKLRMPLRKITSSMPPPSPPLQKQKNCSVLSSMYEKENNPRITTAGTNTKRLVKPRRMSVAIRPPPPMSAQIFQPKRRVSTATYRSEPTSNMTTPLQTSRYKMGIHLSGTHESQGTRSCSLRCQILDGYNACIFAYGQTGTGKTFTMEGSPENRGVNYRTLDELFRLSQERSGIMRYGLFVSMMEVYNEKIRDLLIESSNQPPKKLEIKQTAEGTQEVPGLVETRVTGTEDVWDLLKNSKLTHILQSSLGGDCKTLMFVQISPSATDLGETLCSLNFTGRVRGIESGPARKQADLSELFKYKQMVEKLKHDEKETKKLQDSLQSLQLRLAATERICRTLQEKVRELENQLGEERKTRLKQETRAFAAAASQSTIQVVEKRKIDKKPPLCPSKFGCRCEKSPIPCLHHLLLYKNRKIVLFYLQCMKKKTIQESQLQEQIQKDLRISVAIRPPPPMSAQIFQPKRRVSTATYRSEPTSNMTTPLQTSRHKMGIFRGTDTRNSFTSHLHAALKQKQIDAYIDNKLDGGEKLEPALLEKIEDSYISVVIFSKNYADSTFCLRELSKILECMENKGQKVLPVFHQLDPSQVQDLTGSYGEALSRHERDCASEEVESWRHALKEIANLKGWDSSVIKDETRLIEEIVSDIQKKFKNAPSASIDAAGLVGMQSRVKHIESLLSFGSTSVLTVGIWGKSTTAEAVYNRNSHKFEGRCFFQDVREESKKNGVDHVRQEILGEVLEKKDLNIRTKVLPPDIKRMLQRKKVLIVLDDVNDSQDLKFLVGEDDLFGQGSRIIVTSRDKQVLINACQENRIYKVNELDEDDALRLFSIHAFKKNNPPDEYTMLSNIVVSCVKGIPLVLKVLGASLYKRTSVEYWKSKVAQLGKNGGGDIKKCLKMCYDELDRTEKKIFLDIACFFGRCKRDYLQRTLDLEERSGIDRLIDMCLIKIIENKIWMHDVLLKLGRDIVVHENVDPRKRSRLWDAKDVYRVLREQGTGKVESIYLDLSENKEIDLSPAAFEGMYNLRLLKFYYPPFLKTLSREQMMITGERVRIHLPQGLHFLSNELRILDWSYYPLKSLPSNFFPENLAVRLVCENHRLPCLLPSASFLIAFSFLFSPMTFSFPDFLITAHGGFKINKLPLNIWE
uniref:TIR domain-containing protein n=1 Tax=Salix viminalis TaxID=40686 RepID=A0A6N2L9D9_SALVM